MAMRERIECLMTLREAALYLRLSHKAVRRHCSTGKIPHMRVFGQLRFRRAEMNAWLDEIADWSTKKPEPDDQCGRCGQEKAARALAEHECRQANKSLHGARAELGKCGAEGDELRVNLDVCLSRSSEDAEVLRATRGMLRCIQNNAKSLGTARDAILAECDSLREELRKKGLNYEERGNTIRENSAGHSRAVADLQAVLCKVKAERGSLREELRECKELWVPKDPKRRRSLLALRGDLAVAKENLVKADAERDEAIANLVVSRAEVEALKHEAKTLHSDAEARELKAAVKGQEHIDE